ncbi:MAG: ELWxxDGT repeat protein [Hyalangium sp.]|uniref:ELWxxDGT repeat protein n=1 Tax=Hyalangium sp. TaxID=2028555 RepID=UPI00389A2DC7
MDIRRLFVLAALLGTACGSPPDSPSTRDTSARRLCNTTAFLGADISPGPRDSKPRELVSVAGALFFTADDGVHGRELWRSSGPGEAGASLVKDIRPGVATSSPRSLTVARDKLFFTADDAVHGRELWVSDGSAQGTVMVRDLWPGALGSAPEELLAVGEVVYFAAEDGVHGNELWRSDGTPDGTFLVEDLYPGEELSAPGRPGSSNPRRLSRAGDAFYFVANEGRSVHLWRSLGAPGATRVFSAPQEHFLFSLTAVGSRLFFLVDGNEGEASLWTSQGTPAEKLRSFPGLYPHDLTALGNTLFFSAGAGKDGRPGDPLGEELWSSDGTARGTARVKDLRSGAAGSAPGSFAVLGGRLYFIADDGIHGRELWSSDGTAQGTVLLQELGPGAPGASPRELAALSGRLFFSAESSEHGRESWMSDGTAGGALPLTEFAPGVTASDPHGFVRSGGDIFFTATDAAHGEELWTLPMGRCLGTPQE